MAWSFLLLEYDFVYDIADLLDYGYIKVLKGHWGYALAHQGGEPGKSNCESAVGMGHMEAVATEGLSPVCLIEFGKAGTKRLNNVARGDKGCACYEASVL